MVEAGRGGRIINITSVHEHVPLQGATAYTAAKHGLGGLTKAMALELAEHGITVNAVAPGEIATRMTGAEDEDPHEERARAFPPGARRRPRDRRRRRLPRLRGGELRHGPVVRGRRRDAAHGRERQPAGTR
jgi:NAD(P)-dependent dehydrogenase (short-subunit alcohol dehydrogenase family)